MTTTPRERIGAGALTALMVGAMGAALFWGLIVRPTPRPDPDDTVFALQPSDPPRPRVVPEHVRSTRAAGRASPRNLRSTATEVVAPIPQVPIPIPPPVVVAPVANSGVLPTQGASRLPGPGTGAGGQGDGFGAGGDGLGDGGDHDDDTPPRRIKGRLKDSDYPRAADEAGASGTVSVRYFVEVDGRVSGCRVTRSSGNAALDDTTCRLITQRFRYDPSRDRYGRPVRSIIVVDHDWVMEREPAEQPR